MTWALDERVELNWLERMGSTARRHEEEPTPKSRQPTERESPHNQPQPPPPRLGSQLLGPG